MLFREKNDAAVLSAIVGVLKESGASAVKAQQERAEYLSTNVYAGMQPLSEAKSDWEPEDEPKAPTAAQNKQDAEIKAKSKKTAETLQKISDAFAKKKVNESSDVIDEAIERSTLDDLIDSHGFTKTAAAVQKLYNDGHIEKKEADKHMKYLNNHPRKVGMKRYRVESVNHDEVVLTAEEIERLDEIEKEYGARANRLLQHSYDTYAKSNTVTDPAAKEALRATSRRAHALSMKAKNQHLDRHPEDRKALVDKFMSGAAKGYGKGRYMGDSVELVGDALSEAKHDMAVHVKEAGKKNGKPVYKVHAVGKGVEGIEAGEHLTDTDLDDLADMGHKIKHVKESAEPRSLAAIFNEALSEMDQLDEISQNLAHSYVTKARKTVNGMRLSIKKPEPGQPVQQPPKMQKRIAGIKKALAKHGDPQDKEPVVHYGPKPSNERGGSRYMGDSVEMNGPELSEDQELAEAIRGAIKTLHGLQKPQGADERSRVASMLRSNRRANRIPGATDTDDRPVHKVDKRGASSGTHPKSNNGSRGMFQGSVGTAHAFREEMVPVEFDDGTCFGVLESNLEAIAAALSQLDEDTRYEVEEYVMSSPDNMAAVLKMVN